MQTGHIHNPVITSKNKAFPRFWNNSDYSFRFNKDNQPTIYFTANLVDSGSSFSKVLKNVKFYSEQEFNENFVEFLI